MILRFIIFLFLNFAALGLGSIFTTAGVSSDWYQSLNQAPWTPPGWVFGAAWTTIMICFAIYLAILWPKVQNKKILISLYVLQWILNVSWNPVFFYLQQISLGLAVISALTIVVGILIVYYWSKIKVKTLWLLPYFLWLLIATSLNAYIVMFN